jgi:hypothetical protein
MPGAGEVGVDPHQASARHQLTVRGRVVRYVTNNRVAVLGEQADDAIPKSAALPIELEALCTISGAG